LLARQLHEEIEHLRESPGGVSPAPLVRLASLSGQLSLLCRQLEADARRTPFGRWEQILGGDQLGKTKARLAEAEEQLRNLNTWNLEHEHRAQYLCDQLRQREDKIRRMQQSVSWMVTSPLRWLRRKLPARGAHAGQPTAPPQTKGPDSRSTPNPPGNIE
jgi:hypothetical protein